MNTQNIRHRYRLQAITPAQIMRNDMIIYSGAPQEVVECARDKNGQLLRMYLMPYFHNPFNDIFVQTIIPPVLWKVCEY